MSPATRSASRKTVKSTKPRSTPSVKTGKGDLSAGSVFSESWKVFSQNWLTFYAIVIAAGIVQMISMGVLSVFLSARLIDVLSLVLNMVVGVAVVKAMMDLVDGKDIDVSIVWKKPEVILNFLVASIIYGVICMVGFLLLIVPGVIWSIQFRLFPFLILEKGLGPIDALRASSEITKGKKVDMFVIDLFGVLLTILGFLALLVGLFVAVPVVSLTKFVVYRRLRA